MPPLPSDFTPSDNAARAWLEAMVTRIEDDPDLLAALSDEEVDAALAAEGIRASGVRAAVRRRVREAQTMPARSPAQRTRFNPFRAAALAAIGVIALASLFWVLQTPAAVDPLTYEEQLAGLMRPASKAPDPTAADLLSEGAEVLLSAARAEDAPTARQAAATFAQAYDLATSIEDQDAAAFFAGLATELTGDTDEAVAWLRRVSSGGEYAVPVKDALEALGR